jgi:hypothetical protein
MEKAWKREQLAKKLGALSLLTGLATAAFALGRRPPKR